jgi:hypothetical protein
MNFPWTVESRVPDTETGTLQDADPGNEPIGTIIRVSDGQVYAAGSPFTRVGVGIYVYSQMIWTAGTLYRADVNWTVAGGSPRNKIFEQVGPGQLPAWELADYGAVGELIGPSLRDDLLDVNDDGTVDASDLDRMQSLGQTVDAKIYAAVRAAKRLKLPLSAGGTAFGDLSPTDPVRLWWRNASVRWVILELYRFKIVADRSSKELGRLSRLVQPVIGNVEADVAAAAGLAGVDTGADYDEPEDAGGRGSFVDVPVIDESSTAPADENGTPLFPPSWTGPM